MDADQVREEHEERREPVFEAIETLAAGVKSWEGVAYFGLLVYVATMAYEFGLATYWHIPYALISFTTENAFRTAFVLLLASFAAGMGCAVLLDRNEYLLKKFFRVLAVLLGIAMLFMVVSVMPVFQACVALAGIFFIYRATRFLVFPPATEALAFWAERIKRHMGLAMFTMLLAMPYFAATTGYIASEFTKEYLVLDGQPRQVILRVYGSNALCAELSEVGEVKKLLPGFRLVNLEDVGARKVLRTELPGLMPADK